MAAQTEIVQVYSCTRTHLVHIAPMSLFQGEHADLEGNGDALTNKIS